MKKSYLFFSLLLIVILILSGCEKDYSKEAEKFGVDFLKKAYTVKEADKIIDLSSEAIAKQNSEDSLKPLLTEEAIKNNYYRISSTAIRSAALCRSNVSVEKIELTPFKSGEDKNFYFYNYKITVKLTPIDSNKETQTIDLIGNIIVLHENKDFKVDCVTQSNFDEWRKLNFTKNK
jgi:hypothetical protein